MDTETKFSERFDDIETNVIDVELKPLTIMEQIDDIKRALIFCGDSKPAKKMKEVFEMVKNLESAINEVHVPIPEDLHELDGKGYKTEDKIHVYAGADGVGKIYKVKKYIALYKARTILLHAGSPAERVQCGKKLADMKKRKLQSV